MPAIRFNVFLAVLLAAGLLAPQAWAASEVSGTTALAVYYDNSSSPNIAKNRFWNYSNASWNSPASALALNESEALAWVDLKANPTRDEYVLVAITNSSRAIASVYSNGAWGNELVLSTVTNYSQWGASVVFEHQSGDAIVVWNNGSADVPYAVWNGASWSAFSSILPDSCTAGANWTFLFPRFNSDEAILAYSDGQGRLCGQHWNGSAWDSQSNFENVTTAFADLGRFFSGAFEYSSGRAIVVWESSNGSSSNNGNINYANWTGSGWSARGRASNDVGSENDWISCDSQKSIGSQASNIISCISNEDTGSASDDVNAGQWNGTAWVETTWQSIDASAEGDGTDAKFIDIAFIGQSNKTLIAYVDNGDAFPTVKTCDTGSNCDANADFVTVSGSLSQCGEAANARFPTLVSDAFSNDTLVSWISKDSWNKCAALYNGSTNSLSSQSPSLGTGRKSFADGDSPVFSIAFKQHNQKPWAQDSQANASQALFGSTILFSSLWADDLQLSQYWFEYNRTGVFANTTPSLHSANSSWANFSITTNASDAGKTIRLRVWTNETRSAAWANTNAGLLNSTDWIDVSIIDGKPYSTEAASNASAQNAVLDWILFSARWFDDLALSQYWLEWNATGAMQNQTPSAFAFSNDSHSNVSVQIPVSSGGTVAARLWANDSLGNANATGLFFININSTPLFPSFQWQQFNFTNGSEYAAPLAIAFYANFTDDNGTAGVTLSFNGSNYTMALWNGTAVNGVWNYNLSGLGAGTYGFSYTAFDGAFASASPGFSLYVSKNSSAPLALHLNSSAQNLSIIEGQSVNASGFKGWSEGVLDLLRNATLLASGQDVSFSDEPAAGYWHYTLSYNETQNYSARGESLFVLVSPPSSGGGSSGGGGSNSGNPDFFPPAPTPISTPAPSAQPTSSPSVEAQPSATPLPGTNLGESTTPEVFYSIENAPGGLRVLRSVRVLPLADGGKYSVVTITVFNGGGASLQNVVVSGPVPQGELNFAGAPPQVEGSQAKWILPELRSGESKTFTFSLDRPMAKTEFDELTITAFATVSSQDIAPALGLLILVFTASGMTVWFVRKNRQLTPEQQLEQLAQEFEAERKQAEKSD